MQHSKKHFSMGLLLVILGMMTSQAWAERLFATTRPAGGSGPSALLEVNPATGLIRTIGPVGYAVNGLTYDATTSTLYAITTKNDPSFPGGLITIDTATGAGTTVGAGDVHTLLSVQAVVTLAVNSAGQLYSWSAGTGAKLVQWDKGAGTAAIIGNSGLSIGAIGSAFDNTDSLHLFDSSANKIYQINSLTGEATLLGDLPIGRAHHGSFSPISNLYWGLDSNLPGSRNLLLIDVAIQTLMSSISTENNLHTLAFSPEPSLFLGECDGLAGVNVLDVTCTIDSILN